MSEEPRPHLEDDLNGGLRALGEHDVDSWRRENIRRRAHGALGGSPRARLSNAYRRLLEPALVATVCVVHLVWAFGTTASILLP